MAPIYSQQLVNAVYGASHPLSVVYTVPAGATLVLTNIDALIHNTAAGVTSYCQVANLLLLYHLSAGAEFLQQQWTGKQVLTAGQTIQWSMTGAGSYLAATGYVLAP